MSSRLQIIIPTYRRVDRQRTLSAIPEKWLERTTLVVDRQDFKEFSEHPEFWRDGVRMAVVPKSVKTIAQKRAWILKATPHQKILMLDDDLRFARREYKDNKGGKTKTFKLIGATTKDVDYAFNWVDDALDRVIHCGISARQGNNAKDPVEWELNGRMMYALGYHVPMVRKHAKLGRIEHREDMELCLQLLTKGFQNRLLLDVCVDQTYNTKGGASEERKVEASNEDAYKLARMFPGLVKAEEREYARSVPRVEVTCYWKKAYEQSQKGIQRSGGRDRPQGGSRKKERKRRSEGQRGRGAR